MFDSVRHVYFSVSQPLTKFFGRNVDDFDIVGTVKEGIWHGFADHHAGDLGHYVVEAFQMLNVDGGVHVHSGEEELVDILPAFGVSGFGGVRVGQFVDKDELRFSREGGVEVEFLKLNRAVFDFPERQLIETICQRFGLLSAVGFDVPGDDIDASRRLLAGFGKHRESLAYPC